MRTVLSAVLSLLFACGLEAQKITPNKVEPATAGQPVALELDDKIGDGDIVSWIIRSGKATIRVGVDQKKVEVVPDVADETILVVCIIIPSHGKRKETSAQIKVQAAPAAVQTASAAPPPSPARGPGAGRAGTNTQPTHTERNDGYIDQLGFIPAGFMGSAQEGQTVELDQGSTEQPHSEPTCIKIVYTPETRQDAPRQNKVPWFAIAWQFTSSEPNFGDIKGRNLDEGLVESSRFHSLRVWARGVLADGKPPVVQFKSGGGTKQGLPDDKRASYEVADQFRPVTTDWREYCLDLSGKKLDNVVSAFTIVMERAGNPKGAVIYLDDIHFSPEACPARAGH